MAKKDHDVDDYSDLSFNEFDDDEWGEDSPDDGQRKPSSKIKTNLKQSAEQKFKDAKFRREVLKASLPSDYSSVLEDYDTVSKEVGDVWREQQKHWEKNRSSVKKAIRPYSDVIGKLGFKKLQEWADAEDRVSSGSPSDEEMDELKVQSLMADVFGGMQDQQTQHLTQLETARQEREDERYAEDRADKEVSAKRGIESNTHLSSINNSLTTLSDFSNKIDFPYKKRSLELQARLLVVQQRSLSVLSNFRELAVKELQDIHKNTGLPDYLKINNDEMIMKSLKEKMANSLSAPFDGLGSTLQKRVFGKVKTKMADWWQTLGTVVEGANDANETFSDGMGGGDGTAWGGLKTMLGEGLADKVVGKPIDWAKEKLTPRIREYLEKNHNIVLHGSNLKTMGGQFAGLFNEALKKGETGYSSLDKLINLFDLQDAAVTEKNTVWDKKELDLEKSVFMDNRFKLSVTEVIPGWLKKIYGEVFGFNNKGAKPQDLTWDFANSKFTTVKEQNAEILQGAVKADQIKNQMKAVDRWIEIIGDGASFSKKTHTFLQGWLIKKIRSSDAVNPLALLSDSISASKDVKAELELVLTASMKLTPKQVELAKGGLMADLNAAVRQGNLYANDRLNKAADASTDVRKNVRAIPEETLLKLASTSEGRRALIDAGAAYDDGKGRLVYNYGFDDKISSQFENVRVKDRKENGKRVKHKVGYSQGRRVRFEDGKPFLTDDGREVLLDAQGYEDSEVHLKDNAHFPTGFEELGYNAQQKMESEIKASLKHMPDPMMHPGYGRDFFFTKDGKLVVSANPLFRMLRKKHAPELENKASGGRIRSFAKGGSNDLKTGVTEGQPGDEHLVRTHGGEFVVSHDAAKFNVKLLSAINKYGAPLINADGSVNSVYHKLFGFDKAKDFVKGAGKDFAIGSKNVKNEQAEIAIKNILSRLDFSTPRTTLAKEIAEITDARTPVEKRLPKALKLWSECQKDKLKSQGAFAYGKDMARQGINVAGGKFDKWLDSDGTGTNLEIRDQLFKGAKNVGRSIKGNVTNFASDLKDKVKSRLIDHSGTMEAINKTLAEVENPKMFNKPIDLYLAGKGLPFVTAIGFKRGDYADANTGAIIKNPSQIMGTIVDRNNQVIATVDELMEGVFTRSRKAYRLLGLEEHHRKYKTASEYVANRYSMIASSQRMQDTLQKGKDFRDKYLRDEAVDCYLRTDLTTPILRARLFKEGEYIDEATGSVLWTHHDITGVVKDKQGKVILTAEEVASGLFDDKGVQLKINKFKQIRNMAFRRGAETYNRYAKKHVDKFKNMALMGMSSMGESRVGLNFDDNPVDVYVKGETSPRITFAMFKSKAMIDVKSGKAIMSHSGIQGPVVSSADTSGNQLITDEDLKTGLVDAMGEDLYLPKMTSAGKRFTNYLKEAVLPKGKFGKLRNFMTMTPAKRMEEMNKLIDKYGVAFDVYVKGEPQAPRLTKLGFESSKYISQKTGLALKLPEFIDGPVLDLEGNIILTAEEIAKGLLTVDGKKVKIGVDLKEGGLLNNIMGSSSIMGRIANKRDLLLRGLGGGQTPPETPEEKAIDHNTLYTLKFKSKKGRPLSPEAARLNNRMFTKEDVKGGMLVRINYEDGKSTPEIVDDVENIDQSTWLKSAMSDKITDGVNFGAAFHMGGYLIDDEGKVIKTTFHTGKTKAKLPKLDLTGATPLKGMFGGALDKVFDKLGIKHRLGSWQQQREDKAKAKADAKPEDTKKEKKDSWIGKFIKKLTLPLSLMFGGIASGIGAMKASLLGGLAWLGQSLISKSLLGGLGGFMGRSGLGKAVAVGAVTYGGIKAYNYLDGDASSAASSYRLGDQNGAMSGLDTTSKVLNMSDAAKAAPGATSNGFLATMASNPELASALAMGAMMMPGGIKTIGKGIWGVGKKAVSMTGDLIGWGGRKLAGIAGRTAVAGASRAPGLLGKAGRLASGAFRMSGGGVGLAARMAPMLVGLGGFLLPVAAVAGAFAAGWYAGKGLMKLWNNHKNPWNRFRMAQYGFNHNNEEVMNKIAKLETVASTLITFNGEGKPTIKTDEKAIKEVLTICGLYDEKGEVIKSEEARQPQFALWFKERFLRVFASYLRCLKKIRGKAEMVDLSTLNRKEQETLANDVHFKSLTASPYVITASPFAEPSETTMDATDVDVIFRKLLNKIQTSKDIKDGEVKDYSKIPENADKMDDKVSKPLPKNATPEDKLKAEMDKQLDATTATKHDAKTMVDKANAAVKYQADAANLLTKTHNAQIVSATEAATKETEKQFEKSSVSLMDKFKGFMSSMGNMVSQSFVGDIGRGVAGAYNTTGNAIDKGIDWVGDKIGSLTGKNKETQKAVFNAFKKAGLTTNQAKAITAEVGRENDFNASVIYGSHIDPASSKGGKPIVNVGMLSWNGTRGTKLIELLKSKGLIDSNGKMKQNQAALDVQAQFAVSEMRGAYSKKLTHFWGQPNAEPESFAQELGKNYIVWAYGQDTIRSGGGRKAFDWKSHDQKRRGYLKGMDGISDATPATTTSGGNVAKGGTPFMLANTGANGPKGATQQAAGGIMGNAMGSLDAKYGNKSSASAGVQPQVSAANNVAGSVDWNFDKIANKVYQNRKPQATGKCAEHVRIALQAGDINGKIKKLFGGGLGHAYEYLTNLPKLGFNRVFSGQQLNGFRPMKGDIVVFDRKVYGSDKPGGGGWVYGHVAIWTGGNWISDFVQATIYPHSRYASRGIPFVIFRANGIAKEKVIDCKVPGNEDEGKNNTLSVPANKAQAIQQEKATTITQGADKVNATVNSLNNGGTSTAVPISAPTQADPTSGASGTEVINLLGKQLNVQEQILSVLKDIAKGSISAAQQAQSTQGLTTPNLSAIKNEKSMFDGVKNPVSVLKPV